MHSILSDDDKESNTLKGVKIATEFKAVVRHKVKRIQSKKHRPGTYEINQRSLSCFDDKRFVLNHEIHILAYFHRELRKQILTDDHKKRDSKRFSQMIKDLQK